MNGKLSRGFRKTVFSKPRRTTEAHHRAQQQRAQRGPAPIFQSCPACEGQRPRYFRMQIDKRKPNDQRKPDDHGSNNGLVRAQAMARARAHPGRCAARAWVRRLFNPCKHSARAASSRILLRRAAGETSGYKRCRGVWQAARTLRRCAGRKRRGGVAFQTKKGVRAAGCE